MSLCSFPAMFLRTDPTLSAHRQKLSTSLPSGQTNSLDGSFALYKRLVLPSCTVFGFRAGRVENVLYSLRKTVSFALVCRSIICRSIKSPSFCFCLSVNH